MGSSVIPQVQKCSCGHVPLLLNGRFNGLQRQHIIDISTAFTFKNVFSFTVFNWWLIYLESLTLEFEFLYLWSLSSISTSLLCACQSEHCFQCILVFFKNGLLDFNSPAAAPVLCLWTQDAFRHITECRSAMFRQRLQPTQSTESLLLHVKNGRGSMLITAHLTGTLLSSLP